MIGAKIRKRLIIFASFFSIITILSLLLWKHFTYTEPPFVILGDKAMLGRLHINVYMGRDEGHDTWKTIFLKRKSYPVDNQNVDRFSVYVNYDDKLFYENSYDNIPRMVNDASIADHTWKFCKVGSEVYLVGTLAKCDQMTDEGGPFKFMSFEDIVRRDISERKKYGDIMSKDDEDAYARKLKKAFFDVTKDKN